VTRFSPYERQVDFRFVILGLFMTEPHGKTASSPGEMYGARKNAHDTRNDTGSLAGSVLRYLDILWKHKRLIAFGAVLPALVLGALLVLIPHEYKASFAYEWPLTESEYSILQRRFYSAENIGKIVEHLRKKDFTAYARKLAEAESEESREELISFDVFPAYPKRLQTTGPETSEKISEIEAPLLYLDVRGGSKANMEAICAIITDNIENVLPIYNVRADLKETIRQLMTDAAEIEDNRFTISLDLQQEQARLAKMKGVDGPAAGAAQDNLVLQMSNDPNNREMLPWPYQLRAVQSRMIELEEGLKGDQQKLDYYVKILDLNNRILRTVESRLLTEYTVGEFIGYLDGELQQAKDTDVSDYLRSYIRKTQNLIFVSTRAGEKPIVEPVKRHAVQRTVLTFIVLLMAMTFVAVALEYRETAGRK
jgi:hypothetical protein